MEDADEPPEDAFEAAVWYRGRAGLGDVDAMFNLGVCYEEGRGVAQDGKLACAWCHKKIKMKLKIKKTASTRARYHKKIKKKDTKLACAWCHNGILKVSALVHLLYSQSQRPSIFTVFSKTSALVYLLHKVT